MLYVDERTTRGGWQRREGVVRRARSRPWTAPKTAVLRRELARTDGRVRAELAEEDRRLAVEGDN